PGLRLSGADLAWERERSHASRRAVPRAQAPAARARRASDADRPAPRDAAAEVARAADLRLRPALVGRVRDGIRARRPRRSLGLLRAPRLPDLDRNRMP